MSDTRPIEVGDRFESKDSRDKGRVVEVKEDRGLANYAARFIERIDNGTFDWSLGFDSAEEAKEWFRGGATFYLVETEAHPRNPEAIGHHSRISERGLRTRYHRVSR